MGSILGIDESCIIDSPSVVSMERETSNMEEVLSQLSDVCLAEPVLLSLYGKLKNLNVTNELRSRALSVMISHCTLNSSSQELRIAALTAALRIIKSSTSSDAKFSEEKAIERIGDVACHIILEYYRSTAEKGHCQSVPVTAKALEILCYASATTIQKIWSKPDTFQAVYCCIKVPDLQFYALTFLERCLCLLASNHIIKFLNQEEELKLVEVVYPLVFDSKQKVREAALPTMRKLKVDFKQSCWDKLKQDTQKKFCPKMVEMVKNKETDWPDIWQFTVSLFGTELHSGAQLINHMLEVLERAFKHSDFEWTRVQAFICWKTLISNFKTGLSNPKRVQLLLIPLKASNHRTQSLTSAKLDVYFHFAQTMGKGLKSSHDVMRSFLAFCFGTEKDTLPPVKSYPTLHLKCAFALDQVLDYCEEPELFLKLYKQLIKSMRDCVLLKTIDTTQIKNMWQKLMKLINMQSDLDINKEIVLELFKMMSHLVMMASNSENPISPGSRQSAAMSNAHMSNTPNVELGAIIVTPLIHQLVIGSVALKPQIFTNPAYYSGSSDVMTGTPALQIIEWLLTPGLLLGAGLKTEYSEVISKAMSYEVDSPADVIKCIQSIIKKVETAFTLVPSSKVVLASECLTVVWCILADCIEQYANKGGELNQGNAAEHDFRCIYSMLVLPAQHLYPHVSECVSHWEHIYQIASSQAALVLTMNSHEVCEQVTSKLMAIARQPDRSSRQIVAAFHLIYSLIQIESGDGQKTSKHWLWVQQYMSQVLKDASDIPLQKDVIFVEVACCVRSTLSPPPATCPVLENISVIILSLLKQNATFYQATYELSEILLLVHNSCKKIHHHSKESFEQLKSILSGIIAVGQNHSNQKIRAVTQKLVHLLDQEGHVESSRSPSQHSKSPRQGSILNSPSTVSPVRSSPNGFLSKSGVKSISPTNKSPKNTRRKLPTPMPEDCKFVRIETPPKKIILTEHQKEVMRERRQGQGIPALYQDLTQDTQYSSQDASQDCIALPSASTTTIKEVTSVGDEAVMDFADIGDSIPVLPSSPKSSPKAPFVTKLHSHENVEPLKSFTPPAGFILPAPKSPSNIPHRKTTEKQHLPQAKASDDASEAKEDIKKNDKSDRVDKSPVKENDSKKSEKSESAVKSPHRRKSIVPVKKEPTVTRNSILNQKLTTRSGKVLKRQSLEPSDQGSPKRKVVRKSMPAISLIASENKEQTTDSSLSDVEEGTDTDSVSSKSSDAKPVRQRGRPAKKVKEEGTVGVKANQAENSSVDSDLTQEVTRSKKGKEEKTKQADSNPTHVATQSRRGKYKQKPIGDEKVQLAECSVTNSNDPPNTTQSKNRKEKKQHIQEEKVQQVDCTTTDDNLTHLKKGENQKLSRDEEAKQTECITVNGNNSPKCAKGGKKTENSTVAFDGDLDHGKESSKVQRKTRQSMQEGEKGPKCAPVESEVEIERTVPADPAIVEEKSAVRHLGGKTLRRSRSKSNLDDLGPVNKSIVPVKEEIDLNDSQDVIESSQEPVVTKICAVSLEAFKEPKPNGKLEIDNVILVKGPDAGSPFKVVSPVDNDKDKAPVTVARKLLSLDCSSTPNSPSANLVLKVSENLTPLSSKPSVTPKEKGVIPKARKALITDSNLNQKEVLSVDVTSSSLSADGKDASNTVVEKAKKLLDSTDVEEADISPLPDTSLSMSERNGSMPGWMHTKKTSPQGKASLRPLRPSPVSMLGKPIGVDSDGPISPTRNTEVTSVPSPVQQKKVPRTSIDPGNTMPPSSIIKRSGRAAQLLGLGQAAAARGGETVVSNLIGMKGSRMEDKEGVSVMGPVTSTAVVATTSLASAKTSTVFNNVVASPALRKKGKLLFKPDAETPRTSFSNGDNQLKEEWIPSIPRPGATPDSSILKRKFSALECEGSPSPRTKRKRVSFRDPPLSKMLSFSENCEQVGFIFTKATNGTEDRQSCQSPSSDFNSVNKRIQYDDEERSDDDNMPLIKRKEKDDTLENTDDNIPSIKHKEKDQTMESTNVDNMPLIKCKEKDQTMESTDVDNMPLIQRKEKDQTMESTDVDNMPLIKRKEKDQTMESTDVDNMPLIKRKVKKQTLENTIDDNMPLLKQKEKDQTSENTDESTMEVLEEGSQNKEKLDVPDCVASSKESSDELVERPEVLPPKNQKKVAAQNEKTETSSQQQESNHEVQEMEVEEERIQNKEIQNKNGKEQPKKNKKDEGQLQSNKTVKEDHLKTKPLGSLIRIEFEEQVSPRKIHKKERTESGDKLRGVKQKKQPKESFEEEIKRHFEEQCGIIEEKNEKERQYKQQKEEQLAKKRDELKIKRDKTIEKWKERKLLEAEEKRETPNSTMLKEDANLKSRVGEETEKNEKATKLLGEWLEEEKLRLKRVEEEEKLYHEKEMAEVARRESASQERQRCRLAQQEAAFRASLEDEDVNELTELETQGMLEDLHRAPFATTPVYASLMDCSEPIEKVISRLTCQTWQRALLRELKQKGIKTVGELASLNEEQINRLPIQFPRKETVCTALKEFLTDKESHSAIINGTLVVASSSQTAKFKRLQLLDTLATEPVEIITEELANLGKERELCENLSSEVLFDQLLRRLGVEGLVTDLIEHSEELTLQAVVSRAGTEAVIDVLRPQDVGAAVSMRSSILSALPPDSSAEAYFSQVNKTTGKMEKNLSVEQLSAILRKTSAETLHETICPSNRNKPTPVSLATMRDYVIRESEPVDILNGLNQKELTDFARKNMDDSTLTDTVVKAIKEGDLSTSNIDILMRNLLVKFSHKELMCMLFTTAMEKQ